MCKISVVMAAYNAARHIEKAIRSVIEQTIQDWELIVIDDASTDNTAELVCRLAQGDLRIALHQNERHSGVSETRNRGIDLAVGEYIAFLDSDDIWKRDKLQRQLEALRLTHADLCYTAYTVTRENGQQSICYRVPHTIDYMGLLKENVIGCSTVLLKRSRLGNHPFETGYFHEDYVLWLKLLKGTCTAVGINELLVQYRMGGRSQSKANAAKHRWRIYRQCEKLSFPIASYCFLNYFYNGLKKYMSAR